MARAAVIVNPTKVDDYPGLQRELEAIFTAYGWSRPMWLQTTVRDPGAGQARHARDRGLDLVAVLGGDGTARCAASQLAGTDTPMALLAAGTGNLLARNLGLPHNRYADALRLALSGVNTPIDVLRVQIDGDGDGSYDEVQTGLVMAGIHLDAKIMENTSERLKSRLGWLAYPAAGLRYLRHERPVMQVVTDRGDQLGPAPMTAVLVGNCGQLTGGLTLMPGADPRDGVLDTLVVSVRRVIDWLPVVGSAIRGNPTTATRSLRRMQCTSLTVRCEEPTMVEVDGDVIGQARAVRLHVEPGALRLRMP